MYVYTYAVVHTDVTLLNFVQREVHCDAHNQDNERQDRWLVRHTWAAPINNVFILILSLNAASVALSISQSTHTSNQNSLQQWAVWWMSYHWMHRSNMKINFNYFIWLFQ